MEVEKFQKVRLAALGKFKRSRTNGDASLYETDKTVDVVRPSSFRTQEKNGRTELLSMTEESLKGLAKTYPHYGPIDNPRAAANAICKACE
jgi:hypothetical protein